MSDNRNESDQPTGSACGLCGSTNLKDLGHGCSNGTVICNACGAHWWQRWYARDEWEAWINEPVVRHGFHHAPWDYCLKCAHYLLAETSPTGQQGCEIAFCESVGGRCKSAVLPNKELEGKKSDEST